MALNLLSLARSSGASLHNAGGGKSYSPGTKHGKNIPGTNIKQGAGLKNLASLAKKGRTSPISGKDTKIRKVAGRPSHVNASEARTIDALGPLGEAWVQKMGGGTINPRTGLPEYGWLSSALKSIGKAVKKGWEWLTPSGHTQWFSHENSANFTAAQNKQAQKIRHKKFEEFRRKYEQENIAGIFTEDNNVDDTGKIIEGGWASGLNPQFEQFVKTSGLAGESALSNEVADYLDTYDTRKQTELKDNTDRALEQVGIKKGSIYSSDTREQVDRGAQLSSSMFGMLTESSQRQEQQNFAGAGSFAEKFQTQQIQEEAQRQQNAGQSDREVELKETRLELDQIMADQASGEKDLQDDYNQEFWNNMVSWDSAINS